nr:eukaryotic translation initiation factor 2 gamma subunit [Tanacetum cinerariifolium]
MVESNNDNKAEKSTYLYSFFYGSDGEDTDEEDWPKQRDAETRERMLLASGPPTYRSNRKAVEEARQLKAFNSTHGTRLPPPPSPPPSLNFQELVRLLDEEFKGLSNSTHLQHVLKDRQRYI